MAFGILIHTKYDSWTAGESLYFIFVSFSTIGFGDLVPINTHFMVFWIYSMFGFVLVAMTIDAVVVAVRDFDKWLAEIE